MKNNLYQNHSETERNIEQKTKQEQRTIVEDVERLKSFYEDVYVDGLASMISKY